VALRFQPAGGVDGQVTVASGHAVHRVLPRGSLLGEAEVLVLEELQYREHIVKLGHVDVVGRDARPLEGALAGSHDGVHRRRVPPLVDHVRVGRAGDARDPDVGVGVLASHVDRTDEQRGGAVGDGTEVVQSERVGHER